MRFTRDVLGCRRRDSNPRHADYDSACSRVLFGRKHEGFYGSDGGVDTHVDMLAMSRVHVAST